MHTRKTSRRCPPHCRGTQTARNPFCRWGVGYLTTLAQYAGTSAHIEEYATLVHNKALLRRMIHAAQVIESSALDEPDHVLNALDNAQQLFFQIGQTAHSRQGVHIREILDGTRSESKLPFLRELEQRQERFNTLGPDDPGVTGVPTHFYDLDKMINGLGKSNLIILAARPAMGKTALLLTSRRMSALKVACL